MRDPFARLDIIDYKRAKLYSYSQRIKLARYFAPETEQKLQKRIDMRFQELTRERRQLLELINANPVLRKRLADKDEAARRAADRPKDAEASKTTTASSAPTREREQDR